MAEDTPSVDPVVTAPSDAPPAPVQSQPLPESPPASELVEAEGQSQTVDERSPAEIEHDEKQEIQAHYDEIDTLQAALDAAPSVADSFEGNGFLHSDTVIVNAGKGDKSQIQLQK